MGVQDQEKMDVSAQESQSALLYLSFSSGLQKGKTMPTALGSAVCSTQYTKSNAHFSWKHSHRHTQNNVYQPSGCPSAPSGDT